MKRDPRFLPRPSSRFEMDEEAERLHRERVQAHMDEPGYWEGRQMLMVFIGVGCVVFALLGAVFAFYVRVVTAP